MEIDAIEIIFVIFSFFLFKWLFRILAIAIIAKMLSELKNNVFKSIKGEG